MRERKYFNYRINNHYIYILDFGDVRKFGRTKEFNKRMSSYKTDRGNDSFEIVEVVQVEDLKASIEIERILRKKFKLATVRGHEWVSTPASTISEFLFTITGKNTFWRSIKLNTKLYLTPLTPEEKVNKKIAEMSKERRRIKAAERYRRKLGENPQFNWSEKKLKFYKQLEIRNLDRDDIDELWALETGRLNSVHRSLFSFSGPTFKWGSVKAISI